MTSRNSIYIIYKNMPMLQILINLPFFFLGFLVKYFFFVKKGLGYTYRKGIAKGFLLCRSEEGRRNKIRFCVKRFPYYVRVQFQLWFNIVRRFMG